MIGIIWDMLCLLLSLSGEDSHLQIRLTFSTLCVRSKIILSDIIDESAQDTESAENNMILS